MPLVLDKLVSCVLLCRYAATRGDTVKLRAMLQQGFNPDSSDYGEAAWWAAAEVV
jgi:hypothetical protein